MPVPLSHKRERIDSEEICVSNLKSKRKQSEFASFEIYRCNGNQHGENNQNVQKTDPFESNLTEFIVR